MAATNNDDDEIMMETDAQTIVSHTEEPPTQRPRTASTKSNPSTGGVISHAAQNSTTLEQFVQAFNSNSEDGEQVAHHQALPHSLAVVLFQLCQLPRVNLTLVTITRIKGERTAC